MPITFATLLLASPLWHLSLDAQPVAVPRLVPYAALELASGATDADALSDEEVARQLQQRRELATIHRAFGIATWVAMAATAVLGFIQFGDEYGFHGTRAETACAQGTGVMQEFCGAAWPHAIAAGTTGALYATTFILSFTFPDPLDVRHQTGAYAERVRIHDALHWVHLVGMIAQIVLGEILSNASSIGLDANRDYTTLQALAGVHMGVGIATFGALTAAGALMTF